MTNAVAEIVEDLNEWRGVLMSDIKADLIAPLTKRMDAFASRLSMPPGHNFETTSTAPVETLSRQLREGSDFQTWLKSQKTPHSGFATQLKLPPLSRKAAIISGVSPTEFVPRVYGPAPLPTRLRAFLPVQPEITSGVIEYIQETAFTPAAAVVPEGTLKPSMSATFEMVTQKVATIASTIRMSLQSFYDAPLLSQWVDGRLTNDVLLKEENVFLHGDAANAIQGLLQVAPPFTYTPPATDTGADAIARALGALMSAGYSPDCIVLNGSDYTAMQLTKNQVGSYVLLPGGTAAPDDKGVWEGSPSLWGLPVVISPSMAVGTFLVGAFAAGTALFDRETMNVQISFEDQDNFVKNLVTLRGELRSALAIPVPSAFLQGTLPAGALTAQAHTAHTHPSGIPAKK